jgi:ABC-type sulfate/molybdate transport systems ATPase subunit
VLTSHDPATGLAEADLVLGLRHGRPELYASAQEVGAEQVMELYR